MIHFTQIKKCNQFVYERNIISYFTNLSFINGIEKINKELKEESNK